MYRLGIWLVAFALVLNGAAGGFAPDDPSGLRAPAAHEHLDGAGITDHHDHSHNGVATSAEFGRPQAPMQDHLKCCGRCNVVVVSLLPDAVAIPVTFSFATLFFRTAQDHLVGHLVALDPGIPKSTV